MTQRTFEYHLRREREERRAAANSQSVCARGSHERMAELHAAKAAELQAASLEVHADANFANA